MIAAGALLPKCFSSGSQGGAVRPLRAIANAPAELRYSFHSPDAGNQFWAQQAGIGRLVCQAPCS